MLPTKIVGKIRTHISYSITSLRKLCCLYDNVEKYWRARQATWLWHMRITCWTPKSTYPPLEYVILIALPLQQCLHECTSMLHSMYIVLFFFLFQFPVFFFLTRYWLLWNMFWITFFCFHSQGQCCNVFKNFMVGYISVQMSWTAWYYAISCGSFQ